MNTKEMNEWVVANLALIQSTVRKTCARFGAFLTDDDAADMVNDAVCGLLGADGKLSRFDATRGTKLSTYASHCVANMMIDALRKRRAESSYDTTEGGKDNEGDASMVLPSRMESPDHALSRRESLAELRAELNSDEAANLSTFLLSDYDEEADAAAKGITVNYARVRKARLIAKVRELVE